MIISAGVENLTSWERKLLYMCNARPTINTRALFLMRQTITDVRQSLCRVIQLRYD